MSTETITVRFLGRDVTLERIDTTLPRYETMIGGCLLEVRRAYGAANAWVAALEGVHYLVDDGPQAACESLEFELTPLARLIAPLLEAESE